MCTLLLAFSPKLKHTPLKKLAYDPSSILASRLADFVNDQFKDGILFVFV
jgi:hypothetical protein